MNELETPRQGQMNEKKVLNREDVCHGALEAILTGLSLSSFLKLHILSTLQIMPIFYTVLSHLLSTASE